MVTENPSTHRGDDADGEYPEIITCNTCGEKFPPSEAVGISVRGPSTAVYSCPGCPGSVTSIPPTKPVKDPMPSVECRSSHTDSEGFVTATLHFDNGGRIEYRDTPDGVLELVFDTDERLIETTDANRYSQIFKTPVEHRDDIERMYERYTPAGLSREWPHLAAALLD